MAGRSRSSTAASPRDGAKVAILGGGMGALTAAWELSAPGWQERFASITVYQRGWLLGGKGASGRGDNDRIEEHGLHVWLGYYDNAFALLREVYAELDRSRHAPACPIQSVDDAFIPSDVVGVADKHAGEWGVWVAAFEGNDRVPGVADGVRSSSLLEVVQQAARLLADFVASLLASPGARVVAPLVSLSTSSRPRTSVVGELRARVGEVVGSLDTMLAAALVGVLQGLSTLREDTLLRGTASLSPVLAALDEAVAVLHERVGRTVEDDPVARRSWQLVDLVLCALRGVIRDGVLREPGRLRDLNDVDFRDWLRHHGASATTVDSALIRGVYDLAFAYEDADPRRPSFPAGLGLYLSARMFFDYKGAIFWKMAAGMGDVVFAPLYEALRARGVRFEFFHRVQALRLSPEGDAVDRIEVLREVALAPGRTEYEPLVGVHDLPCWPSRPVAAQLADPAVAERLDARRPGFLPEAAEPYVLRRGEDFDVVVLGISLGALPQLCAEIVAARPEWQAMVTNVRTVPTQAMQLWLDRTEAEMGWQRADATISGFVEPFDTWASMCHVLPAESWPARGPRSLAYFCSVLHTAAPPDPHGEDQAAEQVYVNAVHFLDNHVRTLWPGAADRYPNRFRWEVLHAPDGTRAQDRLAHQYLRANLDPSDQYVQALPGTHRFRLRPDQSGLANVVLAGDWTDTGFNAGCIEAAVISGRLAANALTGRPDLRDIAGLRDLRRFFG